MHSPPAVRRPHAASRARLAPLRPASARYYRGDKGTFTFQVTQSADVVHWWRLLLDPQWPGMVHNVPARSLQLPRDAGPSVAVRLHPSGDAVVIASRRELRVHSVSGTIPSARRAMRLVTAATLQCGGGGAREATLLVAGSISAERADQILFFDCSGLRLLRKCSLDGCAPRRGGAGLVRSGAFYHHSRLALTLLAPRPTRVLPPPTPAACPRASRRSARPRSPMRARCSRVRPTRSTSWRLAPSEGRS